MQCIHGNCLLLMTTNRDDGVGLAAPQVGMNIRMMVFNPYGREKPGSESILVNPGVVEAFFRASLIEDYMLLLLLVETSDKVNVKGILDSAFYRDHLSQ